MAKFRCVIHGSFRKHFELIKQVRKTFIENGVEVLAPETSEIISYEQGFAQLKTDISKDPRLVELVYLQSLLKLGKHGFSYFVNPDGYIGKSASYELGIAQASNVPCFFLSNPKDHPVYLHQNAVISPEKLHRHLKKENKLPEPLVKRNEKVIYRLLQQLVLPGSVVAAGGVIEYQSRKEREKEILLVKTHKWGGRYSIVGGKVRRREKLSDALIREVKEETKLKGEIGESICTFDQIEDSGYYDGSVHHIFSDHVFKVEGKKVRLNEEAQDYVWVPPSVALQELDVEPNARKTIEIYRRYFQRLDG